MLKFVNNAIEKVWKRVFVPWSDNVFRFYMLVGVLGFGGLGIWVEISRYYLCKYSYICEPVNSDAIITAFSVVYPAIMGAASLQLILEFVREKGSDLLPMGFYLLLLAALPALAFFILRHAKLLMDVWVYGPVIFSVIAVFVCCAANSENLNLRRRDYASLGGDAAKTLRNSNP